MVVAVVADLQRALETDGPVSLDVVLTRLSSDRRLVTPAAQEAVREAVLRKLVVDIPPTSGVGGPRLQLTGFGVQVAVAQGGGGVTQHLTEARAHHLRGFATLAGEACRAEDGTTFPEHGWAVQGRRAQTVKARSEHECCRCRSVISRDAAYLRDYAQDVLCERCFAAGVYLGLVFALERQEADRQFEAMRDAMRRL